VFRTLVKVVAVAVVVIEVTKLVATSAVEACTVKPTRSPALSSMRRCVSVTELMAMSVALTPSVDAIVDVNAPRAAALNVAAVAPASVIDADTENETGASGGEEGGGSSAAGGGSSAAGGGSSAIAAASSTWLPFLPPARPMPAPAPPPRATHATTSAISQLRLLMRGFETGYGGATSAG
jgi:uncharacterized membrane protein YgcG